MATSESKQTDENLRAEFIRWLRLLRDENEVVKDYNRVDDTVYPVPPNVGNVETDCLGLAICRYANDSSRLEVTIGRREPEMAYTVAYENERE